MITIHVSTDLDSEGKQVFHYLRSPVVPREGEHLHVEGSSIDGYIRSVGWVVEKGELVAYVRVRWGAS